MFLQEMTWHQSIENNNKKKIITSNNFTKIPKKLKILGLFARAQKKHGR